MKSIHQTQPIVHSGTPLEEAQAAIIMMHGRGANPQDILSLSTFIKESNIAYLAPQAANFSWYPYSFLAPLEDNQPDLNSALQRVGDALALAIQADIPIHKIMLLGFSQGACLSLEFAAHNPKRYGGIAGLSGGLIGPPNTPREYEGNLADTPVFLGCSDIDPHIPKERVHETTKTLTAMGADVTERIYSNMGHTVNEDEIAVVSEMVSTIQNSQ
ncbi:MAG: dienelactone hydrolase family protein [Chloroflexota bacterium]